MAKSLNLTDFAKPKEGRWGRGIRRPGTGVRLCSLFLSPVPPVHRSMVAKIKVPKSVRRQPEGNHSCPGGECGVTRMDLVLGLNSAIVSCSGTTGMLLGVASARSIWQGASQYTNGSRLVENRRPPGEARQGETCPIFYWHGPSGSSGHAFQLGPFQVSINAGKTSEILTILCALCNMRRS